MEGKRHRIGSWPFNQGYTLVEILVVTAAIGIVLAAMSQAFSHSGSKVKRLKVQSYLLKVQAMQSRSWLRSGQYYRLSALPRLDVDGVSLSETENLSEGFAFTVRQDFLNNGARCKTLTITQKGIYPQHCWI
ncbi:hypothetical protein D210916BOD24_09010 [Alteromonas sp. D210916BOD_24]|uniref:type IV pilin protein n=1 Tax=Alteromonas sp. D210916BOD_24 TaxID=3157618 RepID=UPI00399D1297